MFMVPRILLPRTLAKAWLLIRSLVSPLLPDSIRVGHLILLELLEFLERGVLLEISHFRWVIVSGRRLVVHTQARASQVPFLPVFASQGLISEAMPRPGQPPAEPARIFTR